jgi:hypothetical protein
VIDNFEPQPFPLECSTEPDSWMLVLGWQRDSAGRLAPVVANPSGGTAAIVDPSGLGYRLADGRSVVRSAQSSPPGVAPRRSARSE